MADWYCVKGTSGGSGTLLDPWQTITAFNAGHSAACAATDTVWFSGTFTDAILILSKDGTSKDARFTVRGDYGTTNAIIDCADQSLERGINCIEDDYVEMANFIVKDAYYQVSVAVGEGVLVEDSIGCLTRNIDVSGCPWDGIKFRDAEDCEAMDCNCHDNDVRGLAWVTTATPFQAVTRGKASGCTLTGNGRRGFTVSGQNEATPTELQGIQARNMSITLNGEGVEFENCTNCGISNSDISGNYDTGESAADGWGVNAIASVGPVEL